jgi:hypothetical protein
MLSFYLPLNANDMEESIVPSVQELLTHVKRAPDGQKRFLINQLKIRLKNMNTESRKEAMRELKKSFGGKRMQHKKGQQQYQRSSHACSHQPKFRHLKNGFGLRQGTRDGHHGNGHK